MNQPEAALLLVAIGTHPDRTQRIRTLLHQELDWDYLIQAAEYHRVLPLLCRTLTSTFPEAVPEPVLEQLHTRFRTNGARCLVHWRELIQLLSLFEAHGITTVPFKGPVLAACLHGSVLLRPAGDLDLMVHPRHLSRAADLLASRRYTPTSSVTLQRGAALPGKEFHLTFRNQASQLDVELHWRFAPDHFGLALDLTDLWERLKPVCVAGTTVLTLPPEELLLTLCVHGTRHGWTRLVWIGDIAELIRAAPELNWSRITQQARRLRCARMVAVGLLLARNLLGAELPDDVMQWAQADGAALPLAASVPNWLFQGEEDRGLIWKRELFPLLAREHLRDRIRCGLHLARRRITPNAEDHALAPLPALVSFLYYLLRPMRLVRIYGRKRPRFHA